MEGSVGGTGLGQARFSREPALLVAFARAPQQEVRVDGTNDLALVVIRSLIAETAYIRQAGGGSTIDLTSSEQYSGRCGQVACGMP